MRTKLLSFALWFGLCAPALACSSQTSTINTMAIQSPCSSSIVTANQKTAAALQNIAIADTDATMAPRLTPVQVQAPGMLNVEVWTHGKLAIRLTAAGSMFTGNLDLSNEPNGPMVMAVYAWNSAPGDNSYTVNLGARATIIINSLLSMPTGAAGMTLRWSEEWDNLYAISCKKGTGIWPNCAPPTAADGLRWYENKPGGGDFGDAAFEHTDSKYNPYTISNGFLRIRSTYDPAYVDPYGFNRHWRAGLLSSMFPDGSSSASAVFGNGYYEARILLPYDATPGNNGASGGTWPAFWMLSKNPNVGGLEEDIGEWYGNDASYTQSAQHIYAPATGSNAFIFSGHPIGDLTWDFHRYGLLITSTTVTAYLDDQSLGSLPIGKLSGNVAPQWFLMLDFAMGGGWPDNAPPAGYYDMWTDYVRYYAP